MIHTHIYIYIHTYTHERSKLRKFENKRRRQKIMEKVEGGGADEGRLSFFFFSSC